MAGGSLGECIALISSPGSAPAVSYRKDQKSLANFSHLAPLILFFFIFTNRQSQKAEHGTLPPLTRSCPKPLILKLKLYIHAENRLCEI